MTRLVAAESSRVTQSTKYAFTDLVLLAARRLRCALKVTTQVLFLGASMFIGGEAALASNELKQLGLQLDNLQSAKEITLMLVPRGVSYRSRITKEALPKVACVYQISSTERSISVDIIQALRTGILEYEKGPADIGDVRVGVLFKDKSISQDFYFQDWQGRKTVRGVSGEYGILASADLPDLFRAFVFRPGVLLVNDAFGGCSRPISPRSP